MHVQKHDELYNPIQTKYYTNHRGNHVYECKEVETGKQLMLRLFTFHDKTYVCWNDDVIMPLSSCMTIWNMKRCENDMVCTMRSDTCTDTFSLRNASTELLLEALHILEYANHTKYA